MNASNFFNFSNKTEGEVNYFKVTIQEIIIILNIVKIKFYTLYIKEIIFIKIKFNAVFG